MKLKVGYLAYTPLKLAELANKVLASTKEVAIWGSLAALLSKLAADTAALRLATTGSGPGKEVAVAAAFGTLAATFASLATAFMAVPGVTAADLASTSLPFVKERTRATSVPDQPGNLRMRHGAFPGSVAGVCDPPASDGNIRGYEGQYTLTPNDESSWSEIFSFPSSRGIRFSGLERGKDYWFRVRARNTVGTSAWSDPATIMVI
jgi:hypothetical protein